MKPARGFTLLELLIALAIFVVIGVAAYAGLFAVLDARDHTRAESERLAAVQYAVTTLTTDLRQAEQRPVRAIKPKQRAPLYAPGTTSSPVLLLTRGGRANPARLQRSTLARVRWRLVDGALERSLQARVDAPESDEPRRRRLLEDVDAVELRFHDADEAMDDQWHKRWPPLNADPEGTGLPRVIKVTLDLADWGEVRRLIVLPPDARPRSAPDKSGTNADDGGESDGQSNASDPSDNG